MSTYEDDYQKWWESLPEKDFTLKLVRKVIPSNWHIGWSHNHDKMDINIVQQKEVSYKSKKKELEWYKTRFVFNPHVFSFIYPFQCFDVIRKNSLKYSYAI